ncbi:hypothetical protein [Hymenobacter terricola]|uniref:hypothetical protein n=1 Tax=Hymenobacter terricola TaxID=2819236 RepID=UPI001B31732F|nr:hypothetical protein [Hymenobacter terricola]
MHSQVATATAPALGAAARRVLAACRQLHGTAAGLSRIASAARLPREATAEALGELTHAGLVTYRTATAPLLAPAA